jgi:hypothetical protein
MRVNDLEVELEGETVRVLRAGQEVARSGWTGRAIIPPPTSRVPAPTIDWHAIERALIEDIDAELEARRSAAYDAAGVDLTLIDWMLSLSPRERLEALSIHGRSIGRLL